MDAGFWYSIPESHLPGLGVGTIVRVPLGGRRVRGFVAEVGDRPPERLKPITGVSGDLAVFGRRLHDSLVWAAHHYVAPVAVMLERAAPPNLPSRPADTPAKSDLAGGGGHLLDSLIEAIRSGRRRPLTALLAPWEDMSWLGPLTALLEDERSIMVVAATAAEASLLAGAARSQAGERVLEVSGDMDDAAVTSAWSLAASQPGFVVIGTPRVAAWPVAGLAASVVIEEGRRAMKDRQTPTVSVRRLLMTRSRLEGFSQVYIGPTPSTDLMAAGPEILVAGPRAWPLVEVVDRNEDPPGSGLISQRVRAAIAGTSSRGEKVFVFTHRRGYAPAYRCAACRELRVCSTCGSRPEPGEACPRCGMASQPCLNCGSARFEPLGAGAGRVRHELTGMFGDRVAVAGEGPAAITVGTEADLADLRDVSLAVVVDADGLALGSHYRASEEALRVLARVAGRVTRGRGHRMMVQTSLPAHPLITALRRGDPLEFIGQELEDRRRMGYPPASEIVVVEARGSDGAAVDGDLRGLAVGGVTIMGPASAHSGERWLIQGVSLGNFKIALRPLVQRWRDSGLTVRIDVDPLDL